MTPAASTPEPVAAGAPVAVIQCHPVVDSYSTALLDAVTDGLAQVGATASVVRLALGDEVRLDDLRHARLLIVVAPTWWGAMPAELLAWIQRELGPWIDGDHPAATSPLADLDRLVLVTSYGSSRLVNAVQGEPGVHLWRAVLRACTHQARFERIACFGVDRLDRTALTRHLTVVADRVAGRAGSIAEVITSS
ncbi:MAG: NAD(P)H-dependent oxidoreductase [Actinomycetota bacterium]